ncbi:calcium-transporting ATPase 12 plasma membrane-type [Citrus sinensis]|nr:calcium-transporting ATPase 12 plasma membrane-type [Citrus sinensis]
MSILSHEYIVPATPSTPKRKWHSAFAKIYCSRVLHSLAKTDIDPKTLIEIVKQKNLDLLQQFGGTGAVATALQTDIHGGIDGSEEDRARRQGLFGSNTYKKPPTESFFSFVVDTFKTSSKYMQNKKFEKLLSKVSNSIQVDVVRNKRRQQILLSNVVVGDVICLKIGDQVPADGIFLDGHSLQIQESDHNVEVNSSQNPFLLSGTKVVDGYGRMLATAVGMNTTWGQIMRQTSYNTSEWTLLKARVRKLTSLVDLIGLAITFSGLLMILDRYFTGHSKNINGTIEFKAGKTKLDDAVNAVVNLIIPEDESGKVLACQEPVGEGAADHSNIAPKVVELIQQGFALNTTAGFYKRTSGSGLEIELSGSSIEKAILSWPILGMSMDMEQIRQSCVILQVEAFNSHRKQSRVMMRKKADNTVHVHWKGAAEIILAMCSSYYDASGNVKHLEVGARERFEQIIQGSVSSRAEESRGRLSICWSKHQDDHGRQYFHCKSHSHTMWNTQASDQANEAVIQGEEFRNYTEEEKMEKVEKIYVMARASPDDKLAMVKCLKLKGHVVAVTGNGIKDAPALEEANVGLSMGIQGTAVAKESSDIIILDDNFATAVTLLNWGRCVYVNIQKFIQFHLTISVSSVLFNFLAAVLVGKNPLTAVQLLWMNLIVLTLGALALVTEQPTKELMEKPPVRLTEPLITNVMWRNLLAQAFYQIAVLLTLLFKGESVLGVNENVKDTMIFNTFVLCQVFNEFNARKLEKKNVFKGIHKNKSFLGIIGITIVLQVVMVEILKKFADTEGLNWIQWGSCIGIAAISWPIGWFVKCIPVPAKSLSYLFQQNPCFSYLISSI